MTKERLLAVVLPLARMVPVLLIVLLHWRWMSWPLLLVGLMVSVTVALQLWGWRPTIHRHTALILGGLGAALGGMLGTDHLGPLPPAVLCILSGILMVLACAWSLSARLTAAWTSALVLLVMGAASSSAYAPHVLLGVAAMVALCIFLLTHARALDGARAAVFAAYAATAGLGTAGISWMAGASEGVLLPLFEALLDSDVFGSGLGLQSTMSLAAYSSVSLSERVIVEIDGTAPAYFRGQVMDVFDGEVWRASEAIQRPVSPPDPGAGAQELTLTVFTGLRGYLPAPAGTLTRDAVTPEYTAGWLVQGAARRGDQIVLTRRTPDVLPQETAPGAALRALPEELAAALQPLAAEIVGDAQTAAEKADAIEAHLQTQHTYSLTSDLRGEAHPLVVLVSEQRSAYCVYFASAMAAMLRTLSVEARMVGGFVALERSPLTGRTTIRKRDAHAWVEVWLPESERWAAYDPTPSREAVLDITQPGVLRAIQDFLIRLFVRGRSHPGEVLLELLLSPPVLVLAALGALRAIRQRLLGRRRTRRHRGSVAMTDPALWPLYRRYLALLAKRQLVPGDTESDAELLARTHAADPQVGAAAEAFIDDYRRARYRGEDVDLTARLAALEEVLRAQG